MRLAEEWGFTYQCLMSWCKNVGFTPFSWMYSTEHVLFCRRGSLKLKKRGLRLDFEAEVREHSRKPEVFYERVRKASPEPRIDVFSREEHEGFKQFGNETQKFEG
jgi:N6-adenosine-specific RNA methylase IME4